MKKYNKCLVFLFFDIFSVKQLDVLENIKEQCKEMTVYVVDDRNDFDCVISVDQKIQIISSLRCVDSCFKCVEEDIEKIGKDPYDYVFIIKNSNV